MSNIQIFKSMRFLLFFLLCFFTYSKKVFKKAPLSSIAHGSKTLFLTKFDIGVGQGNLTIGYRFYSKTSETEMQTFEIKFGILKDEDYHKFKEARTCEQKQKLYKKVFQIDSEGYNRGHNTFTVEEENHQHIWYLYLFGCNSENSYNKKILNNKIDLNITMFNNGSHFGQDENFLISYIILVFIWIGFLVKYIKPILHSLKKDKPEWTRICIYSGVVLLGLAYFYRFLDLTLVYSSGRGYSILYFLYIFIKNIVEGFLVTLIISIAWGWSLTHLQHDQTYIIIGTLAAICNVVCLILSNAAEQIEEAHHQYDGNLGIGLLFVRIFLFILFIVGIFRSVADSAGKLKHFIIKFGRFGSVYLLGWPVAVIISEFFLPNYMHNEIITFVEEITHLVANAMICGVYTLPDSSYRKVNLKDSDELLPSFSVK